MAYCKPTNPKDAVGVQKSRWWSYLPLQVLVGVGHAFLEGALKYGKHNYRAAGVRASVYLDAAICGHLTPFHEGQDIDPKSGLHHLDKAIASLMVLRDSILQGNWVDDRPIRAKGLDPDAADREAKRLIGDVPRPEEPFTEIPRVLSGVSIRPRPVIQPTQ